MSAPYWLDPQDPQAPFPDPELALQEPDGLLAIGGSLHPTRLINAYRQGLFPWYSDGQPILWWSPDPRSVLYPDKLIVSRSLKKTLKKKPYQITYDKAFDQVIHECAHIPRPGQDGTWITLAMRNAYQRLHHLGVAHSVEAWQEGQLVGGLYGVALGRVFFGESMFAHARDASKVAFVELVRRLQAWDYVLIDCQVRTAHLDRLGAESVPRHHFLKVLHEHAFVPEDLELEKARWQ